MPALNLSVDHGTSLDEAKLHLKKVVDQLQSRFGQFVNRATWSPDASSVNLAGPNVQVDLRVDDQKVHVVGDVSGLGGMLGGLIGPGLKGMIQQAFQKRLT